MLRWTMMATIACLLLAGCGSGKDKSGGESKKTIEKSKDPAQAALQDFKDFVKANFNDGTLTQCELRRIEVVESDSAGSPYAGVLEGSGKEYLPGEANVDGGDVTRSGSFRLQFRKRGNGWVCDAENSNGELKEPMEPVQSLPGRGCMVVGIFCRGTPPANE